MASNFKRILTARLKILRMSLNFLKSTRECIQELSISTLMESANCDRADVCFLYDIPMSTILKFLSLLLRMKVAKMSTRNSSLKMSVVCEGDIFFFIAGRPDNALIL